MQILDRRSASRRANQQGSGGRAPEAAVSNRRRTDRRVSAVRKCLTPDQLDAIRAGGPAHMSVVRVTYVVNGPCFAWLAEVRHGNGNSFMAGAGVLADDVVAKGARTEEVLAAVVQGVRARLHHGCGREPAA